MQDKKITFAPSGRGKARCPTDPNFPTGKMMDLAYDKIGCNVDLPYPAPECGVWIVVCDKCNISIGVTAAGRLDDPTCVIIPCKVNNNDN